MINTDATEMRMRVAQGELHKHCVVCSSSNPRGLRLAFHLNGDGMVTATFEFTDVHEGYREVLHGGVVASVLDGAMTNCLFAHGYRALTAELHLRYHHPVALNQLAEVRAWIVQSRPRLHRVAARIIQGDRLKASASGKFLPQPGDFAPASGRLAFGPNPTS